MSIFVTTDKHVYGEVYLYYGIDLKLCEYIMLKITFLLSWLYTEHRKDRMMKEQKEPEAMINHKSEDATDHGGFKTSSTRIVDTQKGTQKAAMMNGIDNVAFESEQL